MDQIAAQGRAVLVRRNLRNLLRDRQFVVSLVSQPVLIGLGIVWVLIHGLNTERTRFFVVLSSIWFALNASVREIVRDRAILYRERIAGLNLAAFFFAKALALGAVLAGMIALLVLITQLPLYDRTLEGANLRAPPAARTFLVCIVSAVPALALGLAISASVRRERTAVAALPPLLVLNILFSREVAQQADWGFPASESIWSNWTRTLINAVSYMTFTRYGYDLTAARDWSRTLLDVTCLLAFAAIFAGWTVLRLQGGQDEP